MLVNKITEGFVIQVFDTELRRFVSQEFVAGDRCEYEDKDGVPVCSEAMEVDGKEAFAAVRHGAAQAVRRDRAPALDEGRGQQARAGDRLSARRRAPEQRGMT
jgi:hypothetical protein